MNNNYINIVLTADKNYTDVIGVTMVSVLSNLSKKKAARFFIFSQGFLEDDIKKLNGLKEKYPCEIINIPTDKYLPLFDFADINTFKNKWISLACYFRLLLFEFLPDDVRECFYIDSDMIVNTDLSQIKLSENKIFAAVVEPIGMQNRTSTLSHCYELPEFKPFQQNALKYPYFNVGFFLVNLKVAKELNIFKQLMNTLRNNPSLPFPDQDVLNMIFGQKYYEKTEFLPLNCNVFANIDYNMEFDDIPYKDFEVKKAAANPFIIHYAGSRKPWATYNINYYFYEWWKYYKLTPWGKDYKVKIFKLWCKSSNGLKKYINCIFSIRNECSSNKVYKVITISGIKFKLRNKKKESELITAEKKYNDGKKMKIVNEKDAITCRK